MRFLKNIFGQKEENLMGENDIFFHEDLYCQVEILPRENSASLDLENRKVTGFSEEHEVKQYLEG